MTVVAIIVGAAILIAYSLIEKRINQRVCMVCRYMVSAHAGNEMCPRCGSFFSSSDTA